MGEEKKRFLKDRLLGLVDEILAAVIIFIVGVLIAKGRSGIITFLEGTKGITISATLFSIVLFTLIFIFIWRKRLKFIPKKLRRNWDLQIKKRGQKRNPFIVGSPVFGETFFNRTKEVEQIYDLLSRRECCSIISNRRVGKTSILLHISHDKIIKTIGQKFDLNPRKDIFIYFYAATFEDEAQFWEGLCYKLSEITSTQLNLPATKALDFKDFSACIRRANHKGLSLKLLFDEFDETIIRMQKPFFDRLRSLPGPLDVTYLTVTVKSLHEYVKLQEMKSSPFPNIFREIELGLFSEDEARYMLTTLFRRADLHFAEEDIEFLLELAGPHPFFLQIAGEILFNLYISPKIGAKLHRGYVREEAQKKFYSSTRLHFNYYFNKLSMEEQNVLLSLVRKHKTAIKPELVKILKRRVLIREVRGKCVPFSKAFKEFLIRKSREDKE